MPDVFSKSKRSEVMSRIRGKGNKGTELALAEFFRRNRIVGWRRHQAVFGKPDFVFRALKVAVFVDGCFWHGCRKHSRLPMNNRTFWKNKLDRNRRRDAKVIRVLISHGWRVCRIWEHELTPKNELKLLRRIRRMFAPSAAS